MTEADSARWKLDRIVELLDQNDVFAPAGRMERVWALIDGVNDDLDCLEHKAYLFIPKPRTLLRKLTGRANSTPAV